MLPSLDFSILYIISIDSIETIANFENNHTSIWFVSDPENILEVRTWFSLE